MYQNYGVPTKTHVISLDDKQIVFPEDDDSDIIIVNEDYNKHMQDFRVENLVEHFETTTENRWVYYEYAINISMGTWNKVIFFFI